MKKIILLIPIVFLLVFSSSFTAFAAEENSSSSEIISQSDKDNLYNALSDEAKQSLGNLGLDSIDPDKINALSFESILSEILNMAGQQAASPLKSMISILAAMLLYSMLYSMKESISNSQMQQILSIVTTLCITAALVVPVSKVILDTVNVIITASNFMLAYIPIMFVVMISAGQAVSGSAYYSMMVAAGQGVSQVASKVIAPLLNTFLGISIAGAVSPNINLSGFTQLISKVIKWLLGFIMTLFTALLSFKQIITTSMDTVSTRAVRFTLTSLVPVVGSALADAYKTVQSSVNLLKSGLGVFVIISIAVVFLPMILQCLLWLASVYLSKSVGEVLNLSEPCKLLGAVSSVISTLLAILLCIMAIFIISTAVVLMMGGASA